MEVVEIEIDQLIPSSRILRKNGGDVAGMVAVIQEDGIAIRVLARLIQARGVLFLPPTRPNQTTLLISGLPSTSKMHELSKRFRDTRDGVQRG